MLVGALLVLVGIGWLLDAGGVGVPWRAVLPAALIAVGLACVAGAFQGRQHAMMVVGVVLTVVLSVAAAADWDLDVPLAGGVGDRTERPTTPAQLTTYELGVGDLLVDLRQLQVPPGTTAVAGPGRGRRAGRPGPRRGLGRGRGPRRAWRGPGLRRAGERARQPD